MDQVKHGSEISAAPAADLHILNIAVPVFRTANTYVILDHGITLYDMYVHTPEKVLVICQNSARFSKKLLDRAEPA